MIAQGDRGAKQLTYRENALPSAGTAGTDAQEIPCRYSNKSSDPRQLGIGKRQPLHQHAQERTVEIEPAQLADALKG